MGDTLSAPAENHKETNATVPMSSSSHSPETPKSESPTDSPKTPQSESPIEKTQIPEQESSDPKPLENEERETGKEREGGEGEEEEEEGECGFFLFMKGGGCRDSFIEWENCIFEGEKNNEDVVEKCFEVTSSLKKCMEVHPDYYGPILRAEKAAEQEAIDQLEKEREKEESAAASEGF